MHVENIVKDFIRQMMETPEYAGVEVGSPAYKDMLCECHESTGIPVPLLHGLVIRKLDELNMGTNFSTEG